MLALNVGVAYRLIPIRFPDGRIVYIGETEVTNAMWKAYLAATGETRVDEVNLNDPLKLTPAEEEARRRQFIADGWGGSMGIVLDEISVLGTNDGNHGEALPAELIVEGEDSGFAGWSSVRDESLLWRRGEIPDGKEDYPVTFIPVTAAHAFCHWLSMQVPDDCVVRLPTRKEWVWAAYGADRSFPWGNTKHEIAPGLLHPVKEHPELCTPEGLFTMYGNAAEFIHTDADGYGGQVPPEDVPYITQWMGTTSYEPLSIPRKDYFGYMHIRSVRSDCWGFRIVIVPKKRATGNVGTAPTLPCSVPEP